MKQLEVQEELEMALKLEELLHSAECAVLGITDGKEKAQ